MTLLTFAPYTDGLDVTSYYLRLCRWTRRQSFAGSAIETLTYMHPEENLIVTNLTYNQAGADPNELDIQLTVWAYNQSGRDGIAGQTQTAASSVLYASRNASTKPSIPKLVAAGARAIQTSLAVRVVGASSSDSDSGAFGAKPRPRPPPPSPPSRATAMLTFKIKAGTTVSIVTAVADNVVEGHGHNPMPEAVAAAVGADPTAVAVAASSWWSQFYAKSNVSFPGSPDVEAYWCDTSSPPFYFREFDYNDGEHHLRPWEEMVGEGWKCGSSAAQESQHCTLLSDVCNIGDASYSGRYGAQYVAAAMSVSAAVLEKNHGLVPPSGLYGPWVTSDSPLWNGK